MFNFKDLFNSQVNMMSTEDILLNEIEEFNGSDRRSWMITGDKYYRVDNDINMEGIVMPPIGIDKYPFIGSFDGNGKVISNLIVSNNKQELQIRFNVEDLNLGSSIGFFGNIDSITVPYSLATAGEAYSFYLENVNISSNEDNSVVGIVAGYNNGSLYNVGVSNNSFKMAEGKTVESEYTLVGKVGTNVEWYFSPNIPDPGTESSKILVDPTGAKPFTSLEHARTTPTPIIADYLAVPDSMEYHAYYTSRLSVATAGFDKGVYIVDNYSEGTNDNGVPTITPISKGTTVTDINAKDELNDFWVTYKANSQTGKLNYIIPYTAPSFAATVNVPYNNIEGYLDIPYNGIWFKPRSSGSSSMAFSMTSQSSPSMMSVYEFERDENNNIIQSSWKETMFVFSETVYKHSEIAWFNFEVEQGKEYVVKALNAGKSIEQ